LRVIGEVISLPAPNMALIRVVSLPKIGDFVYTEKKHYRGKVVDILGPTSKPYVLIRFEKSPKVGWRVVSYGRRRGIRRI